LLVTWTRAKKVRELQPAEQCHCALLINLALILVSSCINWAVHPQKPLAAVCIDTHTEQQMWTSNLSSTSTCSRRIVT